MVATDEVGDGGDELDEVSLGVSSGFVLRANLPNSSLFRFIHPKRLIFFYFFIFIFLIFNFFYFFFIFFFIKTTIV